MKCKPPSMNFERVNYVTDRYLLDTNIAIAGLKNEAAVRRHLKGVTSYVFVITAGELLHGALKSNERAQNLSTTRSYLSAVPVLFCDMTAAERYSLIRYQLEQQGERIPENDIGSRPMPRNTI